MADNVVKEHPFMNTTTQKAPRPVAVNLAVIILLASFSVSLAPDLVRAEWGSAFVCIKYGIMCILMLVPLWFILRGKNWARWYLVISAVGGFCLSLPTVIQHLQSRSTPWVASYCLRNVIVVGAVAALFLPTSNRWFRRDRNAIAAQ